MYQGSSLTQGYHSSSVTMQVSFSLPHTWRFPTLSDSDTASECPIRDSDWLSKSHSLIVRLFIEYLMRFLQFSYLPSILTTLIVCRPVFLLILIILIRPYVYFKLIRSTHSSYYSAFWCFNCLFLWFQLDRQRKLTIEKLQLPTLISNLPCVLLTMLSSVLLL